MRPLVLLAALTLPVLLTACSGLTPPHPPLLPTTAYAPRVAAAPESPPTVTPLALWRAPGGAYLDVLVTGPDAKQVAQLAQTLSFVAFHNPDRALRLTRADGSCVELDGPTQNSLNPVIRIDSAPPGTIQPDSPRPAAIATLMFRCSVDQGEKLTVRIMLPESTGLPAVEQTTTVQDLSDRPKRAESR